LLFIFECAPQNILNFFYFLFLFFLMFLFLISTALKPGYYSQYVSNGGSVQFECGAKTLFVIINSGTNFYGTANSDGVVKQIDSNVNYLANFTSSGIITIYSSSSTTLYYAVFNYSKQYCSSMDVYIGNGEFKIGGTNEKGVNSTIADSVKLCLLYITKDDVDFNININRDFTKFLTIYVYNVKNGIQTYKKFYENHRDVFSGNIFFITTPLLLEEEKGVIEFTVEKHNSNQPDLYHDGLVSPSNIIIVPNGTYPRSYKDLYPYNYKISTIAVILLSVFIPFFVILIMVILLIVFLKRPCCCAHDGCCCYNRNCCCTNPNSCCYRKCCYTKPGCCCNDPDITLNDLAANNTIQQSIPQNVTNQQGMPQSMNCQEQIHPMGYPQPTGQPMYGPQPIYVPQPQVIQPYSDTKYEDDAKASNNLMYPPQNPY
jgi:hypothetical protein